MTLLCPTTNGLEQDKKFQEVKKAYRDRGFSDYELLMLLQVYREKEDLDIEWYPETKDDYQGFTDFLDTPVSKTKPGVTKESLNELYKTITTLYSPAMLNNRLDRISTFFSDYVTKLVDNSTFGVTRQQVIQAQARGDKNGFDVILGKVFDYINSLSTLEGQIQWYRRTNQSATDEQIDSIKDKLQKRADEFKKMYDNKESLVMLAALRIGAKEGFSVNIDNLEYSFSETEQLEDYNEDDSEDNGVDSGEAVKGDRYVDYRTFSLMSTLSVEARRLLDTLWQVDKDGNVIYDDLGYPVKVNTKQAVISLHKVLQTTTPETLVSDIQKSIVRYPWMKGLSDRLILNPDDRALVYSSFKKSRNAYYYSSKDKTGKLIARPINNVADGAGLSREAGVNVGTGISNSEKYGIVDNAGKLKNIDKVSEIKSVVKSISDYSKKELAVKQVSSAAEYRRWTTQNAAAEWKQQVNDKPVSDFQDLTDVLRGLGFSVDAEDVQYALANSAPIASITGTNRRGRGDVTPQVSSLDRLIASLDEIYNRAEYLIKEGDDLTGSHLYSYTQDEYRNIADILSAIQAGELEERSISKSKSLATAVTPSALHELSDKLSNVSNLSDDEYRQMIMNDYGRFEGMSLGYGDNLKLTGWLSDLYNDGNYGSDASYKMMRKSFKVIEFTDQTISQSKDFMSMTSLEHLINSYVMYARGTDGRTSELSGHMYEVPIQADYETAYNFIVAPAYSKEELIERLAQEVECESQRIVAINERIANDPKGGDPVRAIPEVYENRGREFQIFPELNTNGFFERYSAAPASEAHQLVKNEVGTQLENMLVSQKQKLSDAGMFTGKNKRYLGVSSVNDKNIEAWILNSFYARQQITKLMFGGLEQFKSTSDFEKRNMYSHAQRIPMYTQATYRGEKVGKDNQRVLYLSDDEARSAVYDNIASVADKLYTEGKLSSRQRDDMKKAYKSITTTDGQGLRTLDSMRAVKIMSSTWADSDEVAYRHIKSGKYEPEDVEHFMVGIKPVYTGYEILPVQQGKYQKPVRIPVLHKYSEMVLLPEMLEGVDAQSSTSPLKALNEVNRKLGKNNEIDLFLFGSGVKIGANSVIDAFAKDGDNRILTDSESISDFIASKVNSANFWVHTLPFKYYGITSSMHADVVDTKIAWATQAEKVAYGNILPGDEIVVKGNRMKATDGRELFYRIKTARVIDTFKRVTKRLSDKTEVARILKDEVANKTYQPRELLFALQMRDSGKFSYPLYSPNIQHDVIALLASIVRKDFTKMPTKGANMVQTTSFGMDDELTGTSFDETMSASGFEPLEVKFDDNGNFQYVEAYLPIYDSRLVQFADENGNITPANLEKLKKQGIIPDSILNFIAYRTPSDAEHSVIPCKVKGFINNAAGPSIRLPREIMKMTGHDYDGDKMRCHFKEFYVGWNNAKIKSDFEKFSNTEVVRAILDENSDPTLTPYEVFRRNATSDINPNSAQYRAVKEVSYDYDKSPLENIGNDGDYTALNNALIDLMFAQLTSENGGKKMFIPGGASETETYADTIGSRQSADKSESPFTVTHATDSHDYMMEGAGMIGVYAMYGSASTMFQRLDLHYISERDSNDSEIPVILFGKKFDKLFPVISNETFTSLGLSRLLNAAVDNGKDPLLGYLNQTEGLSHLTNFLLAAGISEEDVHLLFNQPVMKELVSILKAGDMSFGEAANGLAQTMINKIADKREKSKYYRAEGVRRMASMTRVSLKKNLGMTFNDILSGGKFGIEDQLFILQTMQQLNPAASDLEEFTKLTRPESDSGGIDSTLGGIISKLIQLDNFRERLDPNSDNPVHISGVGDVLKYRNIYVNSMTPKMIEDEIGYDLPEVVALNSLMKDSILKLFREYFPQARESWLRVEKRLADQYQYTRVPAKVIERIGNDMILWKLLSDNAFITGNPQEEQDRIIREVPTQLRSLKERIERAKENPGKDSYADQLVDNIFIGNLELGATIGVDNSSIERIRFKLNGASLEDTADTIRADWGAMLYSKDKSISQLAKDLFKYNLYTNGFSYGRYEFAHYAPASIIFSTPGYLSALNNVLTSNWAEDEEENFFHQYLLNHWGDNKLLNTYKINELPSVLINNLGFKNIQSKANESDFNKKLQNAYYILVRKGSNGNYEDVPYRIIRDNFGKIVDLEEAPKMGVVNRHKQVIVQYNPRVRDYTELKPLFTGNKVSWSGKSVTVEEDTTTENISETARMNAIDDIEFGIPIPVSSTTVKALNDEVSKAAKLNNGKLTAEMAAALGIEDEYADDNKFYNLKQNLVIEPDSKYRPTREVDSIQDAYDVVKELFDVPLTNKELGITASISKTKSEKLISGKAIKQSKDARLHALALANIDSLFKNATIDVTHKDTKGIQEIERVHRIGNLMWDKETLSYIPVKITMFEYNTATGNKIYSIEAIDIEKIKSAGQLDDTGVNQPQSPIADFNTKIQELLDSANISAANNSNNEFYLVNRDDSGNIVTGYYKATPGVIEQARAQQAFHNLNEFLRKYLAEHGVGIGVLDEAEARLMAGGVTDFSSAKILAEGLIEMVRLSEGIEGEYALPEEFAHIAIEMLGGHTVEKDDAGNIISFRHENALVSRLLNALNRSDAAVEEAFDGLYDRYYKLYDGNREKLVMEAAGKLVAKNLFLHQYAKTPSTKNLVQKVCDAIKEFFRKFNIRRIYDGIFNADKVASQLARDLLSGRLADEMSLEKITTRDKFYDIEKDLSGKKDILSKMLQYTTRRKDILTRRMKYSLGKGASSRSLDVTNAQIDKLNKAAQNQKLEITVIDYLKDTMDFMSEMEKSLDAAINNRPANAVCKKLSIVKDTLTGFALVADDVRKAIVDGELENTVDLKAALNQVSNAVEDFWTKYDKISMMYLEQFLSNVYGKDGVTVTIGKDRGRKITIEEMARYADRDINFGSRWLSAVSDMNDYVLQAVDDVTRDAKLNARERVRELRPKLEAAFAAVVKEQGSRDQSWMFERRNINGKVQRTGRYISEKQAEKLSPAKREFYKVFMELKHEADMCMPETMVADRKMIMFRKEHYEKMKEAQGIKNKAGEEWENAKRGILEMGEIDYENETVEKDFSGNIIDQLPVKFLNKGKNESYEDMTEDAASSLMAYLGMAFEYHEMNNVIGLLENARYMSSKRDVKQRRGLRNLIEKVGNEKDFHYEKPYTVKQAKSMIQGAMDDFFTMHVYGHLQKDEGTIGRTRISKRKAVNKLVGYTSLTQMAMNIHQRIANVNTGLTQVVVETAGGEITTKDIAKASGIWMAQSADRLAETGKTDYDNKLSLWMDYFDIHQDNGKDTRTRKYGKSDASRAFNTHLLYAGLTVGEDYLSGSTALAYALNFKMKGPHGEDSNLWDAYKVEYTDNVNKTGAYLVLKPGYKKADGTELTKEDERKFQKKVIATNFALQGIYNTDDRSAVQQHSLGALAIMYRKWIAPAFQRRYSGVRYSQLRGDFTEGYYHTAFSLASNIISDWFKPVSEEDSNKTVMQILLDAQAMLDAARLNWNKLTDYEKGNIKKAAREMLVVFGLFAASALLGKLPPDDHDDNKFLCWADDLVMTQLLRLRSEIGSQAPTPNMLNEGLRILSSPFAALRPMRDSINILKLAWIPNYFDVEESGKYKGRTKAHKYFMKSPLVALFRKFDNFVDPTDMLNFYKNQNY